MAEVSILTVLCSGCDLSFGCIELELSSDCLDVDWDVEQRADSVGECVGVDAFREALSGGGPAYPDNEALRS